MAGGDGFFGEGKRQLSMDSVACSKWRRSFGGGGIFSANELGAKQCQLDGCHAKMM